MSVKTELEIVVRLILFAIGQTGEAKCPVKSRVMGNSLGRSGK